MIKLIKNYLTKNRCYQIYQTHKPVGIFLHSVGCPQPNPDAFIKSWNTYKPGGTSVCVHGFIGTERAYKTLPWDCVSWHSGQGTKGNANFMGYLGFEMTEPATIKYIGGASFIDNNPAATLEHVRKTYENAVDVFAQVCIELNFNPLGKTSKGYPVILSHSEGYKLGIASNHGDVEHLWRYTIKKTMDDFRSDVYKKMKEYDDEVKFNNDVNTSKKNIYRVQVGAFSKKSNAENLLKTIKSKGYDAIIKIDGILYKVQVGAFSNKENADKMLNKLKNDGFQAIIAEDKVEVIEELKVGDMVRLTENATIYGKITKFQKWVYSSNLYVREIVGDKVIVSILKIGAITGPVHRNHLVKI